MATTSLWHIKGRLKDLIDYVENPEKTAAKTPELQDLYNVFSYVQRPEATQDHRHQLPEGNGAAARRTAISLGTGIRASSRRRSHRSLPMKSA